MEASHDSVFSGHFGPTRTINLVKRLFFWPEMVQHIRLYVDKCNICQRTKHSNQKPFGALKPLPVPIGKWTNVTVDMITGLPMTARGYNAIIVFVDRLTKMVHIVPTTDTLTSRGFAEMFLTNIIRLHGCPDSVVSDRGSIFHSKFEQEFLKGINCEPHYSSAYHPQSDGQTERANQVLEQVLRSYVSLDHSDWDTFLPMAEFAMNNAPNEAT
jgi:IS30 family transposase